MGGLVCAVHRNAVLQFQAIPTGPAQLLIFDKQLRELYNAPTVAESIVCEFPAKVKKVCDTLAKPSWTIEDRSYLLDVIESLYEPYDS